MSDEVRSDPEGWARDFQAALDTRLKNTQQTNEDLSKPHVKLALATDSAKHAEVTIGILKDLLTIQDTINTLAASIRGLSAIAEEILETLDARTGLT